MFKKNIAYRAFCLQKSRRRGKAAFTVEVPGASAASEMAGRGPWGPGEGGGTRAPITEEALRKRTQLLVLQCGCE